jgi:hypothetical protein
MKWIDYGYDLVWDKLFPVARELKNSNSSRENSVFAAKAISDMLEAGAALVLPPGVRPPVVNPLGVLCD